MHVPRTIHPRSADTDADAERVQVALLRAAPISRRIHLALSLSASVIGAARRAIGRAKPHSSERERQLRFVELHYGCDLASDLRQELERRDRMHERTE